MDLPEPWLLVAILAPAFLAIAAIYSSVGLGGGTGYLAVMALAGVPSRTMPSTALVLNLVVTTVSLVRFGRSVPIRWPVFLPFLAAAVPAAFAGGTVDAPKQVFLGVLSVALGLAAASMFHRAARGEVPTRSPGASLRWGVGLPVGALVGLASGFIGIGGGIFLGPVLLFLRWADPREVALMNSTLILANSAVGLVAHGLRGAFDPALIWGLAPAVLVGGLLGSHLGSRRFSAGTLQRIFAVVIAVAAVKAGFDAWG